MRALSFIISVLLSALALAAQTKSINTPGHNNQRPKIIAGFGSSVCFGSGDHLKDGYIGMLQQRLQPRGWTVLNVSRGGDNTKSIRERWQQTDVAPKRPVAAGSYLLPQQPGYVLIGLSLANEGLLWGQAERRTKVFNQFRFGMLDLVKRCRAQGFEVVIANCYPQNKFKSDHYAAIKAMNALINGWDVASVNLLGTVDDGAGRWVDGFARDAGHPSRGGHREMLHAIPPTLFDALAQGKRPPTLDTSPGHITIGPGKGHGLVYQAGDSMRAMTVAVSVMSSANGTLFTLRGKSLTKRSVEVDHLKTKIATIELHPDSQDVQFAVILEDKQIILLDQSGTRHQLSCERNGIDWHQVLVTHQPARGTIDIYLDSKKLHSVAACMTTSTIEVGAANMTLRDLMIYRSFLNDDEVAILHEGTLLRSSLDVYCPLRSVSVAANSDVRNIAQSLAGVRVGPAGARSISR